MIDCTFIIPGNKQLFFISKIPGQAQHFIGKIIYQDVPSGNFVDHIVRWFTQLSEPGERKTTKCWFIKSIELESRTQKHRIDKLFIVMTENENYYVYQDETGDYLDSSKKPIDESNFKSFVQKWFDFSKASAESLLEATAGYESNKEIQEALNRFLD